MGVVISNPSPSAIKFGASGVILPSFGLDIIDPRIKAGDIVLWSYVANALGGIYAPWLVGVLIVDGEMYFLPDGIVYDPGGNDVYISYIVYDGSMIPP
jgi:hypothetical protein